MAIDDELEAVRKTGAPVHRRPLVRLRRAPRSPLSSLSDLPSPEVSGWLGRKDNLGTSADPSCQQRASETNKAV